MFLKWWDYSLLINVKSELLDCVSDIERNAILHETLGLASQFTEQTQQLARSGCLLYLQDTTAALLSSLGLTLYTVRVAKKTWLIYSYSLCWELRRSATLSPLYEAYTAVAQRLRREVPPRPRLLWLAFIDVWSKNSDQHRKRLLVDLRLVTRPTKRNRELNQISEIMIHSLCLSTL